MDECFTCKIVRTHRTPEGNGEASLMLRWGSPGHALQERCVVVQHFGDEIFGLD